MCISVPARVVALDSAGLTGTVDGEGGDPRTVCFAYLPGVAVGDLVLVHSGFAIGLLDEDQALELQRVLDDVDGGR
ncbi:MAG: HypC/HybG/HupF family hydrogenase formation chaperone [Kribbellaceae bacterium]